MRGDVDDVLSYPTLEWKKNAKDTTAILKKDISEIWGIFTIFDIDKKNCRDSIIVEMTLTRIGTKAYGEMVIYKNETYKIEISESNP